MKKLIIICLAAISLFGCSRSACDCIEDKKELSIKGSDALSRGDNYALESVLEKKAQLEKECEKFNKEDFDKCK
jgi:hypothetical protein